MNLPGCAYPVRDNRARSVLFIAIGMSALVGFALLADQLGPKLEKSGPLHGLYLPGIPWYVSDTALAVMISWPVALAVLVFGLIWSRSAPPWGARGSRMTRSQIAAATILFAPYPIFILGDLHANVHPAALLALPSTAFALWAVYRMQRYHRMPVRVFLFPFAWGLLALGFGGTMNLTVLQIATNQLTTRLLKGPTDLSQITRQLTVQHQINLATFASAGVFEELGKGAALAIVFLVARHRFDGVVSGIVLGASAGLGFNLGETVEYMGAYNGVNAAYQYWARQSIGLMAAHVAFTALTGAGFGIAACLRDRRRRGIAIGSGYLAAAGGHFCTDTLITWFGQKSQGWSVSSAMQTWILTPGQILATSGPFVVLYLLLWRRGLREQTWQLELAMRSEIGTGSGAVSPGDATVLLNPRQRLQRRLVAYRIGGFSAYRHLGRLQNAQLDLATARGRNLRGRIDPGAPDERELRQRVLALRYGYQPHPIGVPA